MRSRVKPHKSRLHHSSPLLLWQGLLPGSPSCVGGMGCMGRMACISGVEGIGRMAGEGDIGSWLARVA